MINYDIRQRVKELASKQGKTQADVMKGIQKAKSQWDQTLRNPRLDVVIDVARLLNCSVAYLIGETDQTSGEPSGTIVCPYCGQGFMVAAIKKED